MDLFAQKSIEYSNGNCYIDGVLQATNSECTTAGAVASLFFLIILIPIFLIGLALFVWWVFTVIHVIKNEDVPNRVLWIVLLFLFGTIIAPIYYFAVQRPYDKNKASNPPASPPVSPSDTPTSTAA